MSQTTIGVFKTNLLRVIYSLTVSEIISKINNSRH